MLVHQKPLLTVRGSSGSREYVGVFCIEQRHEGRVVAEGLEHGGHRLGHEDIPVARRPERIAESPEPVPEVTEFGVRQHRPEHAEGRAKAPDRDPRLVEAVAERVLEGTLRPPIDVVVPLERAGEAFSRLLRGEAQGKVVVTVGEGGSSRSAARAHPPG